MTQTKDTLQIKGKHGFKALPVQEGIKLYFEKECLEDVTIIRRVNEGEWQVLAEGARTPYIDTERFNKPVKLLYKAVFKNEEYYEKLVEVNVQL